MQKINNGYQLSATDLSTYLSCGHAIRLEKELKDELRDKPPFIDPSFYTVKQLGLEHEQRYVDHLEKEGFSIADLRIDTGDGTLYERTIQAIKQGPDYIIQAAFQNDQWQGRADILKKVDKPSVLGSWSYEVMDTSWLGKQREVWYCNYAMPGGSHSCRESDPTTITAWHNLDSFRLRESSEPVTKAFRHYDCGPI